MQYDKLFKLPDLISSSVQRGNTINLTELLWQLNKMIYIIYLAQCLTCHTMLFIHCQHARAQAGTRKRNCSMRTNETGERTKNPSESQSLFLFGNYKQHKMTSINHIYQQLHLCAALLIEPYKHTV